MHIMSKLPALSHQVILSYVPHGTRESGSLLEFQGSETFHDRHLNIHLQTC